MQLESDNITVGFTSRWHMLWKMSQLGPQSLWWLTQYFHDKLTGLCRFGSCVACLRYILFPGKIGSFYMLSFVFHVAFPLQSAGGEWNGTCRNGAQHIILLFHLILWNNHSQCPALISLCGNFSLVPNCGARHTHTEHTSEKKGNNWNCPLPYMSIFCSLLCCLWSCKSD